MYDDFEERTQHIISAYSDDDLLREYEVLNKIMDIDDWCESVLQEVIDITMDAVLQECSQRFISLVKSRKMNNGKLICLQSKTGN